METAPIPTHETKHERKESGIGPIAAIVIVVILLALGGAYFFITQEMRLHQTTSPEQVNS